MTFKKVKKASDCQVLCAMTEKCAFFYVDRESCNLVTDKKASKEEPKKNAKDFKAGPATCQPSTEAEGEAAIPEGAPIKGTSGKVEGKGRTNRD